MIRAATLPTPPLEVSSTRLVGHIRHLQVMGFMELYRVLQVMGFMELSRVLAWLLTIIITRSSSMDRMAAADPAAATGGSSRCSSSMLQGTGIQRGQSVHTLMHQG